MDCKYHFVEDEKSYCKIAEELCGYRTETSDQACQRCMELPNSRCPNSVTASLAIGTLRKDYPEKVAEVLPVLKPFFNIVAPVTSEIGEGPGTELKRILSWFAKDTPSCKCLDHARMMNVWGPQGCRNNMTTILGWLKEEASNRNLPYNEMVVKPIILLAINRAESCSQKEPSSST